MPENKPSILKRSKASSAEGPDGATVEPATIINKKAPDGKGKKKKGKRKKSAKSNKSTDKLDKAILKIQENHTQYNSFLERLDQWMLVYCHRAIELFRRFDEDGQGVVTHAEFKSGMLDLNVPCNNTELYLLGKLLDRDNTGEIDYTEFSKGLRYVRELREIETTADEEACSIKQTRRGGEKCPNCKLTILEPEMHTSHRYILLQLKFVTFGHFQNHPCHLTMLVNSDLTIRALLELIRNQTGVISSKLAVFRDQSRTKEALLSPPSRSLEELGYPGDVRSDPANLTLFYDYTVEYMDCPLLNCDHYFGQKLRVADQ